MSLSNLASEDAQLLYREPTQPGISDAVSQRGAGVEGVGAVPRA
jgi:hypothetical protein